MNNKKYEPKAYEPLCNKHIRFFITNPNKSEFADYVSEKQYKAVAKAFGKLSKKEQYLLKYVMQMNGLRDLYDTYIERNLIARGFSPAKKQEFYKMLRGVQRDIAIELGYIPGPVTEIEWECNW